MRPHPQHGALGVTFIAMRVMQFACLISIIGLTANFISEMNASDYAPPSALVGTLVVAAISVVYIIFTYILYFDRELPLLATAGGDSALLIACIVVACCVGKPVSYLSCPKFPSNGNTANFVYSLFRNVVKNHSNVYQWVDADKGSCYQIKAIWGLSIALCILFAFSIVAVLCLWKRTRGASQPKRLDDGA